MQLPLKALPQFLNNFPGFPNNNLNFLLNSHNHILAMSTSHIDTGAGLPTNRAVLLFQLREGVSLLLELPDFIGKVGDLLLDDLKMMAFGSLGVGDCSSGGRVVLDRGFVFVEYYHVYAVALHR